MERLKIISNNEKKYNLLPQFVQPPLQGRRWRSKANYCLPRHTKFGAWLSGVTAHIHSNLNPRGFQNTQANKLIRLEKTILWSRGNENSKVQSLFVTCILEYLSADFSSSSLKQMKRRLEALFRINVSSAFFVMRPQEARSRGRECGCCWVWVQGGVKGNLLSKTHYCHVGDLGWAGPPRDNRDIPRPRRWDVTRIGTGPRRRHGDTAEPRIVCEYWIMHRHSIFVTPRDTWRSPGSGGMQLPNYSELFARLREGTILASCCYNFDYETFVD